MLLSGAWLLFLHFAFSAAYERNHLISPPRDCSDVTWSSTPEEQKKCAQPVDPVVMLANGSSYIAMMKCVDCPYAQSGGEGDKHTIEEMSQLWVRLHADILCMFTKLTASRDSY